MMNVFNHHLMLQLMLASVNPLKILILLDLFLQQPTLASVVVEVVVVLKDEVGNLILVEVVEVGNVPLADLILDHLLMW